MKLSERKPGHGQALANYALLIALIAIIAISGLALLGRGTNEIYAEIVTSIPQGPDIESPPDDEPPPECYGSLLVPATLALSLVTYGAAGVLEHRRAVI